MTKPQKKKKKGVKSQYSHQWPQTQMPAAESVAAQIASLHAENDALRARCQTLQSDREEQRVSRKRAIDDAALARYERYKLSREEETSHGQLRDIYLALEDMADGCKLLHRTLQPKDKGQSIWKKLHSKRPKAEEGDSLAMKTLVLVYFFHKEYSGCAWPVWISSSHSLTKRRSLKG